MLRLLSIRNFAVVEALEIEFDPGFTVLTGETGAGKSILLDALSLLLGGRYETRQLRPGSERAEIAAEFDVADSIAFLCGPGPMIDHMKRLLASLGVPAGQIRHEVFEAAVAASAAQAEQPPSAADAVAPALAGLSMNCAKTGKTVPVEAGQTLLEAAEAGGVAIEFLCRAGICGTCRTRIIDGDVECTSDALSADERASGIILACVSHPRSNCTVDA